MSLVPQFQKYSSYYDLLYQGKNYPKEADFVFQIIKKFSGIPVRSILSLGCGTGTYERIFAKKGYQVTGVDLSREMLKIAKAKAKQENFKIDFLHGDARTLRLNKKFETVMALFNIAGYQNTNQDFENFLATASRHLKKNGLFVFDAWYLPAVLKDRPQNRIKEINLGNQHKIIRKTLQKLDMEKSILNIDFEVAEYLRNKLSKSVKEKHPMRFFSLNEIEYFLQKTGFKLAKSCVFPNLAKPVSENYWDMFIVAKKI